ncbi:hypothetical protein [Cystobacter ferrugineus]|uniref:Knr4/Smi1-like domain-containing protein n=1 Tax=Cystobacter ferrugineus TaxID=83449 RepID=A0A1L9B8I5_9BACT|nr:hypothetical protein [Cystobacter ferrugineus]OJH38570.1 hypothetical protein BON30_20205 [Cystobacter ferrugineus]
MRASIEAFIALASQWNPGFSERIRGATTQEILELTHLVGHPLSEAHEAFLRHMGHKDGGLALAMEGTTDISVVIDYYRACSSDDEPFPPDCIVIGTGRLSGDVCLESIRGREERVVFTEGEEIVGLYAESLIGLLYRHAFSAFRMGAMPFSAFYAASFEGVGRKQVLDTAGRMSLSLGFQKEWFSDGVVFCGEQKNVLMTITQYEGEGVGAVVAARSEAEVEQVGNALKSGLGLDFKKWLSREPRS